MKRRGILFLLLALFGCLSLCAALQRQQQELSGKLIRLHVVAASDSEEDQSRKLQVRDAVLEAAQPMLQDTKEPLTALQAGLPVLEQAARARLRELGSDDEVTVSLRRELFPTRAYETFSLPAGVYTALRVTVGPGEGHNWWCVVFPSLCMSSSMEQLQAAAVSAGFTPKEVALITEQNAGFVFKFKTLELLQKLKNLLF